MIRLGSRRVHETNATGIRRVEDKVPNEMLEKGPAKVRSVTIIASILVSALPQTAARGKLHDLPLFAARSGHYGLES